MNDVITIGDAMKAFKLNQTGLSRTCDSFQKKVGRVEQNIANRCARLELIQ